MARAARLGGWSSSAGAGRELPAGQSGQRAWEGHLQASGDTFWAPRAVARPSVAPPHPRGRPGCGGLPSRPRWASLRCCSPLLARGLRGCRRPARPQGPGVNLGLPMQLRSPEARAQCSQLPRLAACPGPPTAPVCGPSRACSCANRSRGSADVGGEGEGEGAQRLAGIETDARPAAWEPPGIPWGAGVARAQRAGLRAGQGHPSTCPQEGTRACGRGLPASKCVHPQARLPRRRPGRGPGVDGPAEPSEGRRAPPEPRDTEAPQPVGPASPRWGPPEPQGHAVESVTPPRRRLPPGVPRGA